MELCGKTAIYGGSFNPPHLGHQMVCLYLLEGLGADAVWMVPSFTHPLAKELASFEHRFAMCERLAAPFGERVRVMDIERNLGGHGRTYDTLVHLRDAYPSHEFVLVVGADILEETRLWYRWDDIKMLVPIQVVGRAGYAEGAQANAPQMPAIASRILRERLRAGEDVMGQVPLEVLRYIRARGLYGGD